MPANMKNRGVKFEVIGKHALEWYIEHGRKDVKNFRIRMNIILKDFGNRVADEIKPSEIDDWLKKHDWSPATKNRYKNVFGKTFKIAFADGKVSGNPARLVEQRPEKNARLRFLSAEEEAKIREAINIRCPRHMPEFDIALNTGMRKSEQYSLEWNQISFRRKRILLDETKNGSSREIPMNKTCVKAFEELHADRPHEGRIFQSKYGRDLNDEIGVRSGDLGTLSRIRQDHAMTVKMDSGKCAELSSEKARHIDYGYAVDGLTNFRAERILATGDSLTHQNFQGTSSKANLSLYTNSPHQDRSHTKEIVTPEIVQPAKQQHDFGIGF
jgi:integrase